MEPTKRQTDDAFRSAVSALPASFRFLMWCYTPVGVWSRGKLTAVMVYCFAIGILVDELVRRVLFRV